MRRLPSGLLDRPAPEGARWLALARLRELRRERKRLDDPGDAEALHDFRVALRRLRSDLRAYRGELEDSVSGGMRRRLSRLAQAAGVSRDAEVRLLWIHECRPTLDGVDGPALAWLQRGLRSARRTGDRVLRRELDEHFEELCRRLERRLARYTVAIEPRGVPPIPTTREVMARALHQMTAALRECLDTPVRFSAVRALHRTRIAAKHLRYALEPLAEGGIAPKRIARSAAAAVAALAGLQDDLGRINDVHTFRRWLREAAPAALPGSDRPRFRLAKVQRLLAAEAAESFERMNIATNRERIRGILAATENLAAALRSQPVSASTFRT